MAKTGLFGGGQTPPIFANPGGVFQRGQGGILPERGSRAQYDMVQALLKGGMQSAQASGSPLLAFLAPMAGGAVGSRTEGLYKDAQQQRDQQAIDQLLSAMGGQGGGMAPRVSTRRVPQTGPNIDPATGLDMGREVPSAGGQSSIAGGITETAAALSMDPVDLATIISYETAGTFDPAKRGPTTQWGQHKGLIQFGEPQAARYGVDWNDPAASQLGADGAIARYFIDNGWQPGMGMLDAYSIVNAGAPGRYNASDANNGGAPGTVGDKVQNQMAGHREKAIRLLGGDFSTYASAGQQPGMSQDNMRALIGLMTNQDVSPEIRDLASTMLGQGMQNGGPMSPRDQISMAQSMLGLEQALMPPQSEPGFRPATPEEAAQYGAQAGQIGPDGRFYPSAGQASNSNGEAAIMRQKNEATQMINGAIADLAAQGFSREEAMQEIANDPLFRPQFEALGIDPATFARQRVQEQAEEAAQGNDMGFWGRIFGGGQSAAPAAPAQPAPPAETTDPDPLGIR